VLRKHLEEDDSDLLREMIRAFAERLMAAEVEVLCSAGYGETMTERTNSRNGLRRRDFDTRVGTIELAVPKLRHDSYYPSWLLESRRGAERALVAVVAECYVRGVSPRRVEGLVKTLGIEHLSKSQVSRMAKELDARGSGVSQPPFGHRALHLCVARRQASSSRVRPLDRLGRSRGRCGVRQRSRDLHGEVRERPNRTHC
jgi:hypothetical protein